MEEKRKYFHKESFLRPIWIENPLFVLVLGTCPALAITKTFEASFGMGILFTFVLVFSNILISALRKVIPDEVHIPCYIVIIATFVTITKMMTEAFLPELYSSLGVFLALLVVNCIVLGRAEAFANKNSVGDSLLDGLGNGLGFTIAICIIGVIREILGTGMLTFGNIFTFLKINGEAIKLPILKAVDGSYDFSISLFSNPAGGFIVFGVIMAIIAAVENHKKELARQKALEEKKKQAALKAQQAQAAAGGEQQ
ncbi:MAG: electron transport complex subunit RsxE [Bacilli bacterium]|nr:electron transport complex subunit RsxE [Bacilli bacterium]